MTKGQPGRCAHDWPKTASVKRQMLIPRLTFDVSRFIIYCAVTLYSYDAHRSAYGVWAVTTSTADRLPVRPLMAI